MKRILLLVTVFAAVFVVNAVFISNLDAACMRCLCHGATGCNMTAGCKNGYCGPYYIARIYWVDADKQVLLEDDPERAGAYQDCANDPNCAKVIVENYMTKYGRDCNNDGVTDCDDYAMIHFNGGVRCEAAEWEGTNFYNRYVACHPRKPEELEEEEEGTI